MTRLLTRFVLLVVMILGTSLTAQAERTAWDQAKVSELGNQLAAATKGIHDGAENPSAADDDYPHHRMLDHLRLLEHESHTLARQLGKGRGHGRTLSIFERIGRLAGTASNEAKELEPPQATLDALDTTKSILGEMHPYYVGAPMAELGEQKGGMGGMNRE